MPPAIVVLRHTHTHNRIHTWTPTKPCTHTYIHICTHTDACARACICYNESETTFARSQGLVRSDLTYLHVVTCLIPMCDMTDSHPQTAKELIAALLKRADVRFSPRRTMDSLTANSPEYSRLSRSRSRLLTHTHTCAHDMLKRANSSPTLSLCAALLECTKIFEHVLSSPRVKTHTTPCPEQCLYTTSPRLSAENFDC